MEYPYGAGTVKIIPASAFRDVSLYQQQFPYDYSQEPLGHPINGAYYMGGVYNPAYLHEPYGQSGYIDPTYGDTQQQQYPSYYHYNYPQYNYHQSNSVYPGAYGPYPGASGGYRAYPQPAPSPPRRSRTAPSRPRSTAPTMGTLGAESRRGRGISAEGYDRRQQYQQQQQYKGPVYGPTTTTKNNKQTKKPIPMYRKKREPPPHMSRYQETDFGGGGGGGPIDSGAAFTTFNRNYYGDQHAMTLRRLRPYYAPSYTTYPPSTMHPRKYATNRSYPTWLRIVLKIAQVILGAAVIGLVLGPSKGNSYHDFLIRTNTEWQGLVLGIAVIFTLLSAIFGATAYCAHEINLWRKADGLMTACGCFFWLLAGFVEAYYAACYPPNGARINLVCHRAEWIIACIFAFFAFVAFLIDFVMSWMAGVSML